MPAGMPVIVSLSLYALPPETQLLHAVRLEHADHAVPLTVCAGPPVLIRTACCTGCGRVAETTADGADAFSEESIATTR